jgi:hypothetical protein
MLIPCLRNAKQNHNFRIGNKPYGNCVSNCATPKYSFLLPHWETSPCQTLVTWIVTLPINTPLLNQFRVSFLTIKTLLVRWDEARLLYDWRSVSMSWYRAPFGTCDQILLPVGMLLWGALSDERTGLLNGRSRSWSYFTSDGQSVSQQVLVSSTLWDLRPDITSCPNVAVCNLRCCFCGAPSLTRGWVCKLQCNHSMVRVAQNP